MVFYRIYHIAAGFFLLRSPAKKWVSETFFISSPAFPSQEKRVLGIQRSAEIKGDLLARDPSNIYI
jgi:hypothetical protein